MLSRSRERKKLMSELCKMDEAMILMWVLLLKLNWHKITNGGPPFYLYHKRQKKGTCCICLEKLRGDIAVMRACKHSFCASCLEAWLRVGNSCPICRSI